MGKTHVSIIIIFNYVNEINASKIFPSQKSAQQNLHVPNVGFGIDFGFFMTLNTIAIDLNK